MLLRAFLFFLAVFIGTGPAQADTTPKVGHVLGLDTAPIRVDEYASITCSHCAKFVLSTLPEIQTRYIDKGLVKFVLHDFPLDGFSLKAAAVAHCLPKEQYLPFIRTLYDGLLTGSLFTGNAETNLFRYASLGGLPPEKAKACANDPKIQQAIVADRTDAVEKYQISGTPTFVINEGEEIVNGAQSTEAFAAIFERLLAKKKK